MAFLSTALFSCGGGSSSSPAADDCTKVLGYLHNLTRVAAPTTRQTVYVAPDDRSLDAAIARAANETGPTEGSDAQRVRDLVYASHAAVHDSPKCFTATERVQIDAAYDKWKR